MLSNKLVWVTFVLTAVAMFIVGSMVTTLEPTREAWQNMIRDYAAPSEETRRSSDPGPVDGGDIGFEKMLNSAKETYFSIHRKEDADRKQIQAYAREQAIRAQSLANTKEQRFRVLFLLSVLTDAEDRKSALPANGKKLMELAETSAQKGRAQYIVAEGHKENQRNREAMEAYRKSAEYLTNSEVRSKTDRVFGIWQLGHAADVMQLRLKEPEQAKVMYTNAIRRLDQENTILELDGPIREAILLNMAALYDEEGDTSAEYTELTRRQQEVMQQMKKVHPERTGAYIAEQWERIKLNKI